jgi:hypothetical protein
MERKFHVVFSGQLHSGFSRDEAVDKMVLSFQLDRQKVARLLVSGRPTIMKQNLTYEQARKYKGHLEQIGLRMSIIEAETPSSSTVFSPPASRKPVAPKPPKKIQAPQNPLPQADSSPLMPEPRQSTAKPEQTDDYPPEEVSLYDGAPPFKVGQSHGWLWIKNAFMMLFRQPFIWTAMIVLLSIFVIPVALIPFGGLLSALLMPIFQGGMMLGAQHQMEGEGLRIVHLFHGFNHSFTQLLLVGFVTLFGTIVQVLIFFLCSHNISAAISAIIPHNPEIFTTIFQVVPPQFLGLLLALILSIPLMMGVWFAPCLVALDGLTAFSGFRLSFRAVRINFVAFLIYSLAFLLLGILFMFFYGAVAALFLFLLGSDHSFLFMLLPMLSMVLIGTPLATIVPLSIYAGYRDIFHGHEDQRKA